ncbi:MAG TPA: metal-dependent hydrolase [Pirellulaceae bacterium]|jgi:membrane-bound metal-dependent hydrolase YbcI (DUF457 family)|nr:metal-dependent hydrolase [Pirellulaceae bacterium]
MAGFKTHITVSTACGVGIAGAGIAFGMHPSTCILTGTLCSVAGMLPDIDSDSGVPLRETMSFGAAILPMMFVDRLHALHWSTESIAVAAVFLYAAVRFGVAEIIKRYTVHRGMWHSLPAAGICAAMTFLIVSGETIDVRLFKTAGVVVGFLSHLIVDEIWSVKVGVGGVKVKKSFGTALKFFGPKPWANMSVYGKLALLAFLLPNDPMVMEQFGYGREDVPKLAQDVYDSIDRKPGSLLDRAIERTSPTTERVRSMLAQPQPQPGALERPAVNSTLLAQPAAEPPLPMDSRPSVIWQPQRPIPTHPSASPGFFAPAPSNPPSSGMTTIPTTGLRESPSSAALPLPGAPLYPR